MTTGSTSREAEHQMPAEHHHVEIILVGRVWVTLEPFEEGDRAEVNRVCTQDGEQAENKIQHPAQFGSDRADIFLLLGRGRCGLWFVAHGSGVVAGCFIGSLGQFVTLSTARPHNQWLCDRRSNERGELRVFRGELALQEVISPGLPQSHSSCHGGSLAGRASPGAYPILLRAAAT